MKFLENPRAHFAREVELDEGISQNVVRFVVDNFYDMYHLDSITENNLNHFFDFMISYRDCYHNLGLYELVDCANYVLDSLVLLLPDVGDSPKDKFHYRSRFYRPPEDIHFIEPIDASICLAKLRQREQEMLECAQDNLPQNVRFKKMVDELHKMRSENENGVVSK